MKDKKAKFIKELLPYVIILIIVLLVRHFCFTIVVVNGPSMDTTLHDKDIMILNKLAYKVGKIKRFDIVVIDATIGNRKTKIIKRVIGLPNETVEYKDGKLYINDKIVEDKYAKTYTKDFEKVYVKEGNYFVLGDNRIVSQDSRYIGTIPRKLILGKARFTIFPFNRLGFK